MIGTFSLVSEVAQGTLVWYICELLLKTGWVSVCVCFHVSCSNMFSRFLLLKQVSAYLSWLTLLPSTTKCTTISQFSCSYLYTDFGSWLETMVNKVKDSQVVDPRISEKGGEVGIEFSCSWDGLCNDSASDGALASGTKKGHLLRA